MPGMELAGDALPEPADDREFEAGGRQLRQRDYRSGATLLVRSLLIDGMGHAWSGGDARLPYNDASGPDASRLIIEFLLQHRLAQNRFSPQPLLAAR
jgi:poly(3-hydroxybutyrate) depolymerase